MTPSRATTGRERWRFMTSVGGVRRRRRVGHGLVARRSLPQPIAEPHADRADGEVDDSCSQACGFSAPYSVSANPTTAISTSSKAIISAPATTDAAPPSRGSTTSRTTATTAARPQIPSAMAAMVKSVIGPALIQSSGKVGTTNKAPTMAVKATNACSTISVVRFAEWPIRAPPVPPMWAASPSSDRADRPKIGRTSARAAASQGDGVAIGGRGSNRIEATIWSSWARSAADTLGGYHVSITCRVPSTSTM